MSANKIYMFIHKEMTGQKQQMNNAGLWKHSCVPSSAHTPLSMWALLARNYGRKMRDSAALLSLCEYFNRFPLPESHEDWIWTSQGWNTYFMASLYPNRHKWLICHFKSYSLMSTNSFFCLVFFLCVAWIPHTVMAETNSSLETMNKLNKQWSKQNCSLHRLKGWFVEIEFVCLWLLQLPIVYFIKHTQEWRSSLNKEGESERWRRILRMKEKQNDVQRQNKWKNKFLALAQLLKSQQALLSCRLVHLVADCPLQSN